MSRELLILIVGTTLLLIASIGLRYLGRKWGIPIKTRNIVGAIVAAFGLSWMVCLLVRATWDKTLFFSMGLTGFIGAYLWLRNKYLM
jgi:hypothetical protein